MSKELLKMAERFRILAGGEICVVETAFNIRLAPFRPCRRRQVKEIGMPLLLQRLNKLNTLLECAKKSVMVFRSIQSLFKTFTMLVPCDLEVKNYSPIEEQLLAYVLYCCV